MQAAFLALAAGSPPQPGAPCPVPSPFFALLGKAGGTPPRPRVLTPEALEALGGADALLSSSDAWADPGLWQGGAGLGLGLGPEAPAADVLAGCASFQAAALARPGPFFGAGMPSTGSTESDGTFAGAAAGACDAAGFDLQQVGLYAAVPSLWPPRQRGQHKSGCLVHLACLLGCTAAKGASVQ